MVEFEGYWKLLVSGALPDSSCTVEIPLAVRSKRLKVQCSVPAKTDGMMMWLWLSHIVECREQC